MIENKITEDYSSFASEYPDIKDFETSTWDDDRLRSKNPTVAARIKDIKRLWNKHVDRQFIQSLVKVHWLHGKVSSTREVIDKVHHFLANTPRNDELSVSLYTKNQDFESHWGNVGIILDGRITFASNDMDALYTGAWHDVAPEKMTNYRKTSGVPRRATVVYPKKILHMSNYIFDSLSFNENDDADNEGIIDNWRPISIVLNLSTCDVNAVQKVIKLPIVDALGASMIDKSSIVESFVKTMLQEKTRYQKETGRDSAAELRQYLLSLVSDTHPAPYAFTMTKIPKVGLNPQTSYNTPAGVYFYPLTKEYCQKLIDDKLPFASDNPYFGLVKLKGLDQQGKWLKFINRGFSELSSTTVFDVEDLCYPSSVTAAQQHGKHWNFNDDAKVFDLAYFETRSAAKPTSTWNKLLRQFGFIGIYDSGNGIVHPSEPTQLVALSPAAYQVVGIWEIKELRRMSEDELVIKSWTIDKKMQVLQRKFVQPEVLYALSKVKDMDVRCAVALHMNCPKEALQLLSKDDRWRVRYSVAQNINCSKETLQLLLKDEDWDVVSTAKETLQKLKAK